MSTCTADADPAGSMTTGLAHGALRLSEPLPGVTVPGAGVIERTAPLKPHLPCIQQRHYTHIEAQAHLAAAEAVARLVEGAGS